MDKLLKILAVSTAALLLASAAFAGGMYFDRVTNPVNLPGVTNGSLDEAVNEVSGIIKRDALKPSTDASITAGAIEGMVGSLEDSHAAYFDRKHYEYFNEQSSGIFYGIGITISNEGNDLVVRSVIAGTPAEEAGLKTGDVIVTIDGESRPKWDSDEAVVR